MDIFATFQTRERKTHILTGMNNNNWARCSSECKIDWNWMCCCWEKNLGWNDTCSGHGSHREGNRQKNYVLVPSWLSWTRHHTRERELVLNIKFTIQITYVYKQTVHFSLVCVWRLSLTRAPHIPTRNKGRSLKRNGVALALRCSWNWFFCALAFSFYSFVIFFWNSFWVFIVEKNAVRAFFVSLSLLSSYKYKLQLVDIKVDERMHVYMKKGQYSDCCGNTDDNSRKLHMHILKHRRRLRHLLTDFFPSFFSLVVLRLTKVSEFSAYWIPCSPFFAFSTLAAAVIKIHQLIFFTMEILFVNRNNAKDEHTRTTTICEQVAFVTHTYIFASF